MWRALDGCAEDARRPHESPWASNLTQDRPIVMNRAIKFAHGAALSTGLSSWMQVMSEDGEPTSLSLGMRVQGDAKDVSS